MSAPRFSTSIVRSYYCRSMASVQNWTSLKANQLAQFRREGSRHGETEWNTYPSGGLVGVAAQLAEGIGTEEQGRESPITPGSYNSRFPIAVVSRGMLKRHAGLQRSGIPIKLDIPNSFGRLFSDIEPAIFRLVQECLTNIRHSGSKTASIRLFVEVGSLEDLIKGKEIPPDRLAEIRAGRSGVDIRGMQEHLHQFGAK